MIFLLLLAPATAYTSFWRPGWLDRLVEYRKEMFVKDLVSLGTFDVQVREAPPGYKDSPDWDYDSVQRLLALINTAETTKPLRRKLEETLKPTRRYSMSHAKSLYKIPSIAGSHPGFFYDYEESEVEEAVKSSEHPAHSLRDDDILYISNPVESRMPSRHISVGLMKEILYQRSLRSRQLSTKSTTTKETKKTTQTPKKLTTKGATATTPATTAADETTPAPDDGGGDAEETESTTAADDDAAATDASETETSVTDAGETEASVTEAATEAAATEPAPADADAKEGEGETGGGDGGDAGGGEGGGGEAEGGDGGAEGGAAEGEGAEGGEAAEGGGAEGGEAAEGGEGGEGGG